MPAEAEVPWVRPLPAVGAPPLVTPHAALFVLAPAAAPPPGADLAFRLPALALVAYVPTGGAPEGSCTEVAPDPLLRGNAFRVVHESARSMGATLSIAAGRRLESGPESERLFVVLRGAGLVFLQNEETMRFAPLDAIFVPAGEPVRVWAQGPEDVLAVVLQPRDAAASARRTLASEIRRVKAERGDGTAAPPSS